MAKCSECKGTGKKEIKNVGGKPFKICPKCKGTGKTKGGRPKKDEGEE